MAHGAAVGGIAPVADLAQGATVEGITVVAGFAHGAAVDGIAEAPGLAHGVCVPDTADTPAPRCPLDGAEPIGMFCTVLEFGFNLEAAWLEACAVEGGGGALGSLTQRNSEPNGKC